MYRVILNIVGNGPRADDIAQEVFLSAFKSLRSFDPAVSRFSTWLFTIARNRSLNALRKKREVPLDGVPERAGSATPQDHYAAKEFYKLLDRALADLPSRQKTAFVLATSIRFVPLVIREIRSIHEAQVLRGARILPRDLLRPWHWPDLVHCLLVPVIVQSMALAAEISQAARARDFGISDRRTCWPGP